MNEEPKIYFNWLQVGRFLAAFWVLLHHGQGQLFFPSRTEVPSIIYGHYGVDFFFVLSGFVIMLLNKDHLGKKELAGSFIIKRLNRLLPLVFLLAAPRLLQDLLSGVDFFSLLKQSISDIMLLPATHKHLINNAWSLRFEMVFYIAFAILMIYGKNLFWIAVAIMSLVITSLHISNSEVHLQGIEYYVFSKWNLLFMTGCLIGHFEKSLRYKDYLRYSIITVSLFSGLVILYSAGFAKSHEGKSIYDILGSCLVFGSTILILCSLDYKKIKPPKILTELGNASYAIYLIHGSLLFHLRHSIDDPTMKCIASWILVPVIFYVSYLVYKYYEHPVNKKLNKLFL